MSGWHRETWFETPQQGRVTRVIFGSGTTAQHEPKCQCDDCKQRRDSEADEIVEHMQRRGIVA